MIAQQHLILLAEDSADDSHLIQRAFELAKLPFKLHIVANGREAAEYLAGKNSFGNRKKFPLPDVVLTDLKMPQMDGFELVEWIRRQSQFQNLPVVVLTGSHEVRDRLRALEMGATSYMVKDLLMSPPPSFTESLLRCIGGGRSGVESRKFKEHALDRTVVEKQLAAHL